MAIKTLGTIGVLVFCLSLAAAEPPSPSENGSAVRGPMPGEFNNPGTRISEEPDASRPSETTLKPEDGTNVRAKKKTALDRDKDRARIDEEPRANRVLVSRPHRSR